MSEKTKEIWEWTGDDQIVRRTAPRAEPAKGHVEIKVKAIGICGTDLHIVQGKVRFASPPFPLGHEISGIVERVGPGADEWLIGKRVCVDPLVGCGYCTYCTTGMKDKCEKGNEIGIHMAGGWQQYMEVPESNLHLLPNSLGYREATQAETLHCCLGGIDKLDLKLGMKAAVVGDGPTGLLFIQLLALSGVHVTLFGLKANRLRLARELGADDTINLLETEIAASHQFDVIVDAAGSEKSIGDSLNMLKKGGQMLLFGIPENAVRLDVQNMITKDIRMIGTTNDSRVWSRVLYLMETGKVKVAPLLSKGYPFESLDKAVRDTQANQNEWIKTIVTAEELLQYEEEAE